jgi:GNAT superfamily N-acetyltransferase
MVSKHSADIVGHVVITPETAAEPELAVFVHPEYRHRGIGTELSKQAIAYATTSGYTAILMDIGVVNKPALSLATAIGFEFTEDIQEKDRFDLIHLRHSLNRDGHQCIDTTTIFQQRGNPVLRPEAEG